MTHDIADLCDELDKLADLMADSEDLRVRETPIVERLNELCARYSPRPGFCEHDIADGEWCEPCNKAVKQARIDNRKEIS